MKLAADPSIAETASTGGRTALPAGRLGSAHEAFEQASRWRGFALALVAASRDCVKLVDLDGRVVAVSPAALKLLQLDDAREMLGRNWAECWPESERGRVRESMERAKAGEASSFQGFCPTAKGEPRWWDVTVAPVADETGAVRRLLAASRDITALRDREQELQGALERQRQALLSLSADFETNSKKLRDAESRVSHSDKLSLFGRFVGGVVHDFNNVFAAVHGAARLLRRRITEPTALDVVSHMERAAERGAGLARQLLDFARNESEPAEVFDPAQLIARDAHLLRHIVSAEATLALEPPPDAWPVLGSPQKFQSVLFNLVANARDAAPPNGRVEVSLGNCASLVRPQGLDAGDYVCLTVSDDGCGMSPEALARAGEPFFTTKPSGKGTGLGLASAFELAASCGGRAFVESRQGVGTRVSVYMRRSAVEGETVAAPDATIDPALHGRGKLLLVDDDALVRDHLASVFRELNYVVIEASSFEIAAATADGESGFDLVVTDLNLRDGRGDKLVARLRARQPGLPAIFVTGSSGFGVPRGETVLRKPVSETRLARAILEKLGRLPGAAAGAGALRHVGRIADKIQDADMKRTMSIWREHVESSRRIPLLSEAGPWRETLPPLGYVAVVRPSANPEFRFLRAGAELSARLGRGLEGTALAAGDSQLLGDVARALHRRLDGSPGYDYARFALGDGKISIVERLVLPLAQEDGRVGHVFGLVAFGEIASPIGASRGTLA